MNSIASLAFVLPPFAGHDGDIIHERFATISIKSEFACRDTGSNGAFSLYASALLPDVSAAMDARKTWDVSHFSAMLGKKE
jgi:hypothetical protein